MPFGYNQSNSQGPPLSGNFHSRKSSSSRGMGQPTADLLSLVPPQEGPKKKKVPRKRNHNHLGAPSPSGSHSGGKRKTRNDKTGGDKDQESSDADSSSTQDDEDADDENDEDDEEPAVSSPVRVNRKRKYNLLCADSISGAPCKPILRSDFVGGVSGNGTTTSTVHLAGHIPKRRSYSATSTNTVQSTVSEANDAVVTETDEEPACSRKRAAHQLLGCDGFVKCQTPGNASEEFGSETENDGFSDNDLAERDGDDDIDGSSLSAGDISILSEEDDEDIEAVEAQELAREFELEGPDFVTSPPQLPVANDLSIYDGLLSDMDCVGEPGLPGPSDHLQWTDLSGLLYYDSLVNDNLFSVPDSPGDSQTARTAYEKSSYLGPEVFHSDEWSDDDLDETLDPELDNPFFEMHDPAVQHLINNNGWDPSWNDSEESDDCWKHCVTGESSSGESDTNEEGASEKEDDYDSDATDLEENLPQPTPQKDSKLERLSSATVGPQVLHQCSSKSGPFLGSWITDPDRPICIIDGTKKTVLIPACSKRFSLDDDASCNSSYPLDNDFDGGAFSHGANNPTLSGISGGDGDYLNGHELCGHLEAFNPSTDCLDFDNLLKAEYDENNEDSIDDEEQVLTLEDVLALSETEDEGDHIGDQSDVTQAPNTKTETNSTLTHSSEAEAMLSRWDYVSVTAFRKRQQQHKQRLSGQGNKNRPAIKSKLTLNDTTMSPARRRKFKATKQKTPLPMGTNRRSRKEDSQWSSHLPPLFEAV